MPTISQTQNELLTFITAAERAWFDVFDSGDPNKKIGESYLRLPLRFSTRAKIITYFRKYWGIRMSNRMFCSLHTITRNNRLYVYYPDVGSFNFIPLKITVTGRTSSRIRLTAVLTGISDDDNENVRYLIAVSGNKLRILDRDNKDYRYERCR